MRWLSGWFSAAARLKRRGQDHVSRHGRLLTGLGIAAILASGVLGGGPAGTALASTKASALGELDCNGDSPMQHALKPTLPCTDIRGSSTVDNTYTWGGRFYDNGVYIGHDEPDMTFLSSKAGSGDAVTWTETLGSDPRASPTVTSPGKDVSHWFELSPAPWFSMAMCDPLSYPQNPCTPQSDSNALAGAGSAFMEMQFYPPGFAPFVDADSCDNIHWCAALTIDSLECTLGFASCNNNCIEPVNFAFIQTNGVPTGPPSPQRADLATFTSNSNTLLMMPGDNVTVHMSDAPAAEGGSAFKVVVDDTTQGTSGFMQASAANGFQDTSITNCSGTPFNFQPEYNTAARSNIVPWAALQTDISTEYEIGHFIPCSSITGPSEILLGAGVTDTYWKNCQGKYEDTASGGGSGDINDAPCYPQGDTHMKLNTAPDTVTGCLMFYYENGDLDFDGSPYWSEWPTATSPGPYPASFVQSLPTTSGHEYSKYFIQTDVALSESTCSGTTATGCSVPPANAPGQFYPYWSRVGSGTSCTIEFGNLADVTTSVGEDSQYGTDQIATQGYPEFWGSTQENSIC